MVGHMVKFTDSLFELKTVQFNNYSARRSEVEITKRNCSSPFFVDNGLRLRTNLAGIIVTSEHYTAFLATRFELKIFFVLRCSEISLSEDILEDGKTYSIV